MSEPKFITHDFNLPCHDNELSNAGDKIEKLKNKVDCPCQHLLLVTNYKKCIK